MAASQLQAAGSRVFPTLINASRLAFTRVFNGLHHTDQQRSSQNHSTLGTVPLAVSNAGGFELEQRSGSATKRTPTVGIDDAIGGGPSLPRSIEFLVVNNVPVKPERLLRDLAWDRLLSEGSALDPLHRAAAREQVDRLGALQRQGMKIDPQMAIEIFRRFATWTDLLDLGELLSRRPAPSASSSDPFGTRVDLYLQDIDLLERMRDRATACMAAGDYVMAQELADRALQKSGRLCALLNTLRDRLEQAEARSTERLWRCTKAAGGFVLVAMGASYMGYASELPSLPSSLLAATAEAATLGSVVCVLATTAQWLTTPDFAAHLDRVQRMQLQREVTRNQIDTLACEAMMESATPPAMAPASPSLVGLHMVAAAAVEAKGSDEEAVDDGADVRDAYAYTAASDDDVSGDSEDGSFELVAA